MTAELWLKTPCEHGELDSHHVGDEYELCEDQGWVRLDPDKAVFLPPDSDESYAYLIQDVIDALEEE